MNGFRFHTTPSIVLEDGASGRIAALTADRLGARILFVTDPGIVRLGLHDAAVGALRAAGRNVTIFDRVEADPSRDTLMACVAAARGMDATGIVGFGGGSSLDVAKLAALLCGGTDDLDAIWGVGLARGPRLPLVLIPTTAGTGSEVTPVAIITVGAEEKRGVSTPLLLPDMAILDPELTLSLPAPITAATGIDAMVHAIEAYASANPNNNPISRNLACQALQLLSAHIETVISTPGDRAARAAMLLGSLLAGQAFANSPVAAVHALAYPLGGVFHLPHGLSNALVLPHVLRFNLPAASDAYAALAAHAFPDLARIADPVARTSAFIDALAGLSARVGLPQRLRDVDIPQDALPRLAADAMKQTRLLVNNPRPVDQDAALSIYTAAW